MRILEWMGKIKPNGSVNAKLLMSYKGATFETCHFKTT